MLSCYDRETFILNLLNEIKGVQVFLGKPRCNMRKVPVLPRGFILEAPGK